MSQTRKSASDINARRHDGEQSLKEYRDHLVLAEQKAQEDFDKTVLSLSGGALGVSFAFVKDIAGNPPFESPILLFGAWACWACSVMVVLASYFFSHLALRRAIRQVDSAEIYNKRVGGVFDLVTAVLNALGGILFLVGVFLVVAFVQLNLEVP